MQLQLYFTKYFFLSYIFGNRRGNVIMEKYRQKLEICQEDEDIPLNQTKPKKKKPQMSYKLLEYLMMTQILLTLSLTKRDGKYDVAKLCI